MKNLEDITTKLNSLKDYKYEMFNATLVPGDTPPSIRIPVLKELGKEIAQNQELATQFVSFTHTNPNEIMLHGILLGYLKYPAERIMDLIELYLPSITNWAFCDVTVMNLKIINKNLDYFHPYLLSLINSRKTYYIRFGIVAILNKYLKSQYAKDDILIISKIDSEEYYIKMAQAWALCEALIKQYDFTIKLFKTNAIQNDWVHNKAIQKCIESYRVSDETKVFLQTLKR